jgi:hypothetical protein
LVTDSRASTTSCRGADALKAATVPLDKANPGDTGPTFWGAVPTAAALGEPASWPKLNAGRGVFGAEAAAGDTAVAGEKGCWEGEANMAAEDPVDVDWEKTKPAEEAWPHITVKIR